MEGNITHILMMITVLIIIVVTSHFMPKKAGFPLVKFSQSSQGSSVDANHTRTRQDIQTDQPRNNSASQDVMNPFSNNTKTGAVTFNIEDVLAVPKLDVEAVAGKAARPRREFFHGYQKAESYDPQPSNLFPVVTTEDDKDIPASLLKLSGVFSLTIPSGKNIVPNKTKPSKNKNNYETRSLNIFPVIISVDEKDVPEYLPKSSGLFPLTVSVDKNIFLNRTLFNVQNNVTSIANQTYSSNNAGRLRNETVSSKSLMLTMILMLIFKEYLFFSYN